MAWVKNIPFQEARSVQFRAEFFNIFNFVNFGAPTAALNNANFGVILSARGPHHSVRAEAGLLGCAATSVIEDAMKTYDVLVVGTGASGGMAAKVLTEHGIEVLLLEAGPAVKPSQFLTHAMPYDFPYRGAGSPGRIRKDGAHAASEHTPFTGYYAEFSQHPYTTPPDKPWDWSLRSRILGGRTLHWGRQSFRLAAYDFRAASRDGYGADWPFAYDDLEPYYDKVEQYIGVQGRQEGLPQIPDGKFPSTIRL
jgi:choline dehydrogenase-like flavoprotein